MTAPPRTHDDDIVYPETVPFLMVHLACFAMLWTGVTRAGLLWCVALYLFRMFVVTAGYHRYFSHRSYRTSRLGQFVLGFLCQTSAQRGILWWAAKHRAHHRFSDTPDDPHSPRHAGFWMSHVGWIFAPRREVADYELVRDLARYPELVWLDRHKYLPAGVLAVAVWLAAGWSGLVVGFFFSTVLLYHGSFAINSLAHLVGRRRYETGDDSRNNWWLALITLGEGWHNNHHHYQSSVRQGFRWWEIDVTYYLLRVLAWCGLVWDLKVPPAEVVRGQRRLPRAVLERVAGELAASVNVERLSAQIREAWAHAPSLEELRGRAREAWAQAVAVVADVHLPRVLSVDELKARAREMFAQTPSLNEIVERARQVIAEGVSLRLLAEPPAREAP